MSECIVLQTQEVSETDTTLTVVSEKASRLNQSQFKYADPSAALSPWEVREEPKVFLSKLSNCIKLCVNITDTQF